VRRWLKILGAGSLVAVVVACLAHSRQGFDSNFGEVRLGESAIVDRGTGEPYSGRLIARGDEINTVGCWVLSDTPLEPACRAEAVGLILDAPVESGHLHGVVSIRADLTSDQFGPAVQEMFGDLSGLAQTAVPTVEVARAHFVDGKLEGKVEMFEPSADPTASTLRAEATFVGNRLEGIAREYKAGSGSPSRELSFAAGVRSGPQRRFFTDGSLAEVVHYVDGKPDGETVAYYADGSERRRGVWKAGERVGVWEAWYPDGAKRRREAFDGSSPHLQQWYSNGELALEANGDEIRELPPHGLVVEYYDSGQVRSKRHYDHGLEHGAFEVFYQDGGRWERGAHLAGVPDGDHEKWWKNGRAALKAHYVGGQLEGQYERWYASGEAWEKATYRAGERVGDYRKWWKNRALAHEYRYVEGKLEGDYRTYYDNGAKWAVGEFRSGKPVGQLRRWFPDGRLGYLMHTENGRPHGPYKRWWADGSTRLEATYANGKLDGEFRNWLEDGTVYEVATYEAGKKIATTLEEGQRSTTR